MLFTSIIRNVCFSHYTEKFMNGIGQTAVIFEGYLAVGPNICNKIEETHARITLGKNSWLFGVVKQCNCNSEMSVFTLTGNVYSTQTFTEKVSAFIRLHLMSSCFFACISFPCFNHAKSI